MIKKLLSAAGQNKAFTIVYLVLVLICVAAIIFGYNNDSLYSQPIARIIAVESSHLRTEYNEQNISENYYTDRMTAVITNGERKGEKISLSVERSESGVFDVAYHEGNKVFLVENPDGDLIIDGVESYGCGVKRDIYVIWLVSILVLLVCAVAKFKGLLALLSIIINLAVLCGGVYIYTSGVNRDFSTRVNIVWIAVALAVIFSLICLVIINGFKKMTLAAVISTLAGTFITFGVAMLVILLTDFDGLYVEMLEFLVIEVDYRFLFTAELLLGGLGAIMDVSVTMAAAFDELCLKDPGISRSALMRSGRNIGKDIMSTMINVLLFTYICGSLPFIILALRNGVAFWGFIRFYSTLSITRFLVGSIGIVLTIPLSQLVCILLFKGAKSK